MNFISGNVSNVIELLLRGAFSLVRHIHHLERDLDYLDKKLEGICRKKEEIDKYLQKERRCRKSEEAQWMDDVGKKRVEIENIKEKYGKIMSNRLLAYFPGFWGQYRISRRVLEHIEAIKELDQGCPVEEFDRRRIPLCLAHHYISLESFKEKQSEIEELLTQKEKVRNIGIWGSKGAGKTTLLKNIYNSDIVRKYFDYNIFWIDCRNLSKDRTVVQKQILDTLDLPTDSEPEVLRNTIYSHLKEQLFLLILDDFQGINDLDILQDCAGLPLNENKCKIVFGCEKEELWSNVGEVTSFKMTRLSEKEGWELFRRLTGEVSTLKEDDKEYILKHECLPKEIADRASQARGGDNFLRRLLSKKFVKITLYFLVLSVCLFFLLSWHELQIFDKRLGYVCAVWVATMISIVLLWPGKKKHRDQNGSTASFDGESSAEVGINLVKNIFADVEPQYQIGRSTEVAEPIHKKRRWKCRLSCVR